MMNCPKISVILETARYKGLDWQLKLLANQTFQNFELILIDGCWEERETAIIKLAQELGIDMKYIREQYPFKTGHTRPINVNICMKFAKGDYFVFLDDYHVFPNNFLEEHFRICEQGFAGIVKWDIVKYEGQIDYSVHAPTIANSDPRQNYFIDHKLEFEKCGDWFIGVPWDWWWPNSVSVPAKYILAMNGFNELYCGGEGGEDNDVAYRMAASGLKFAYNPKIVVHHIQHGSYLKMLIPMRILPYQNEIRKCGYQHDRRPFTKNEYWPHGNPNLIENDQLFTWFENGYKLYQCKHCGEFGCIDGQQMLQNTKNRCEQQIYVPPEEINFPDGSFYKCTNLKGTN